MTAIVVAPRLDEFNTVPIARFGHRLALGVQWIDALSEQPLAGPWATELERIGARPLVKRLIAHGQGRHALLHRDAVARLLRLAASELAAFPPPAADPSELVLRGHGADRRHVPRRVALTPVLGADGEPPVSTANIRRLRLWPGAEYPVPAGCTVLRGRIRRGAAMASAQPVPWARVVITRPAGAAPFPAPPVFDDETPVGWAHGDDRGEFLAVLGAAALPGGALLPATMPLTVWVSLPAAIVLDPLDPDDALASLPLEAAGTTLSGALLNGTALPPGHVRQVGFRIAIPPGQTTVLPDVDLRFA